MIYLVPAHCTICIGGQTVLGVGCSAGKSLDLFVALCLVLPVVVVVLLVVQSLVAVLLLVVQPLAVMPLPVSVDSVL